MKYSLKDLSVATIAAFCIYTAVEKEVGYVSLGKIGDESIQSRHFTLKGCQGNSRVIPNSLSGEFPNHYWEEVRPDYNIDSLKFGDYPVLYCVPK